MVCLAGFSKSSDEVAEDVLEAGQAWKSARPAHLGVRIIDVGWTGNVLVAGASPAFCTFPTVLRRSPNTSGLYRVLVRWAWRTTSPARAVSAASQ
jgi:hypothetical protein